MEGKQVDHRGVFAVIFDSSLRDECGGKAAHPLADGKVESSPFGLDVHVVGLEDVILRDFCTEGFQIRG